MNTMIFKQVSFQSQRKAMTKNIQAAAQLHSSHTLVKQWTVIRCSDKTRFLSDFKKLPRHVNN